MSEDSIKGIQTHPFTLNQYSYCWNQPLNLVDLDGLKLIAFDCGGSSTPSSNQRKKQKRNPISPPRPCSTLGLHLYLFLTGVVPIHLLQIKMVQRIGSSTKSLPSGRRPSSNSFSHCWV